jgi:hypothetical protein
MNLTTNIITAASPTPAAIDRAIRNAARSTRRVEPSVSHATIWYALNPADRADYYTVDTLRGTCDCPAFAREGVCKHQVLVDDEIAVREVEEGMESAADEEAARCCAF